MGVGHEAPQLVPARMGIVLVLTMWSQESEQLSGISDNRVDSWSFAVQVVMHTTGLSSSTLSKCMWRKATEEADGTGSVNKCSHHHLCDVEVDRLLFPALEARESRKATRRKWDLVDGKGVLQIEVILQWSFGDH